MMHFSGGDPFQLVIGTQAPSIVSSGGKLHFTVYRIYSSKRPGRAAIHES